MNIETNYVYDSYIQFFLQKHRCIECIKASTQRMNPQSTDCVCVCVCVGELKKDSPFVQPDIKFCLQIYVSVGVLMSRFSTRMCGSIGSSKHTQLSGCTDSSWLVMIWVELYEVGGQGQRRVALQPKLKPSMAQLELQRRKVSKIVSQRALEAFATWESGVVSI